ncbi:hypothetical protein ACIQ4Z_22780 [Peribacillus asahii]
MAHVISSSFLYVQDLEINCHCLEFFELEPKQEHLLKEKHMLFQQMEEW